MTMLSPKRRRVDDDADASGDHDDLHKDSSIRNADKPTTATTNNSAKRHGYDWYSNTLGQPRHICAPMVDQSELPFRLLCIDYDTDVCYTPMINSKMVLQSVGGGLFEDLRGNHVEGCDQFFESRLQESSAYQAMAQQFNPVVEMFPRWGDRGEECGNDGMHVGPTSASASCSSSSNKFLDREFSTSDLEKNRVIAQFCGDNPNTVLAAARLVEPFVAGIDLNCGCPQGIAKKGHYGAYLLQEPDLITSIISKLHTGLRKVPATCKIRKVNNSNSYQETMNLVQQLVDAGVSAVTIHGRTKEEKGQHTRAADWECAKLLKERFGKKIPIFCNGGIEHYGDVLRCFEETKCDAVMSSEGLLEDPQLFAKGLRDPAALTTSPRVPQDIIFEQYCYYAKRTGTKLKTVKAHCFHMLYAGLQTFTDLRAKVGRAKSIEELESVVVNELRPARISWEQRKKQVGEAAKMLSSEQAKIVDLDAVITTTTTNETDASVSATTAVSSSSATTTTTTTSTSTSTTTSTDINDLPEGIANVLQSLDEFPNLGWYRRYRNPIGGKKKDKPLRKDEILDVDGEKERSPEKVVTVGGA
ncbi:unnamed protein product [Amoebophrya sp. A25]|nr:unnamed protein product [Amoebophrya sp. A25]|eukprot:GSA25T00020667001.1